MKHIRVEWKHANPAYPILLFSELDDDGWEIRKVEVFADGRCGYASSTETSGETHLGIEPVPPLSKIADDAQFTPAVISADEFEQAWAKR